MMRQLRPMKRDLYIDHSLSQVRRVAPNSDALVPLRQTIWYSL